MTTPCEFFCHTLICCTALLIQGNTALDTVLERLANKAESGQSYDLEEEHAAIRELLRREMRKLGYEPPRTSSHRSTEERTVGGRRNDSQRQTQQKQAQKQVLIAILVLDNCIEAGVTNGIDT